MIPIMMTYRKSNLLKIIQISRGKNVGAIGLIEK